MAGGIPPPQTKPGPSGGYRSPRRSPLPEDLRREPRKCTAPPARRWTCSRSCAASATFSRRAGYTRHHIPSCPCTARDRLLPAVAHHAANAGRTHGVRRVTEAVLAEQILERTHEPHQSHVSALHTKSGGDDPRPAHRPAPYEEMEGRRIRLVAMGSFSVAGTQPPTCTLSASQPASRARPESSLCRAGRFLPCPVSCRRLAFPGILGPISHHPTCRDLLDEQHQPIPDFQLPATSNQRFRLWAFKAIPSFLFLAPTSSYIPGSTDKSLRFPARAPPRKSRRRAGWEVFGISRRLSRISSEKLLDRVVFILRAAGQSQQGPACGFSA